MPLCDSIATGCRGHTVHWFRAATAVIGVAPAPAVRILVQSILLNCCGVARVRLCLRSRSRVRLRLRVRVRVRLRLRLRARARVHGQHGAAHLCGEASEQRVTEQRHQVALRHWRRRIRQVFQRHVEQAGLQ